MSEPAPSTVAPLGPGRARQNAVYRAGALGHRPRVPADPERLALGAPGVRRQRPFAPHPGRGVDGGIVSNHGGRQTGHAGMPVVLDSGARSGADVVTALALGAAAVTVGRPHIYGLAVDGEAGVRTVLENLVAEVDLTMGLCGVATVADLGPETLRR